MKEYLIYTWQMGYAPSYIAVEGYETAWNVYRKMVEVAEMVGEIQIDLVDGDTGEVIQSSCEDEDDGDNGVNVLYDGDDGFVAEITSEEGFEQVMRFLGKI